MTDFLYECNNHLFDRDIYNFVSESKKISGIIQVSNDGHIVDGKSLVGLLSLGIKKGDIVNITIKSYEKDIEKIKRYLEYDEGCTIDGEENI